MVEKPLKGIELMNSQLSYVFACMHVCVNECVSVCVRLRVCMMACVCGWGWVGVHMHERVWGERKR